MARQDMRKLILATFKASGMSMLALSRQSGVGYQSVHAFVTGDRDVALSTTAKLCAVLGLELAMRKAD